jgi:sugar phosphate isomerase/epimerase
MQIGYCCNVHPGRTINEVQQNLTEFSLAVKELVRPEDTMGIGLWLSETASRELAATDNALRFRDWLSDVGLLPFTLNGFPFGDFHQAEVKHHVYEPTWAESSRLDYTIRLAEIQDLLLPETIGASISTLPLGWPTTGHHARDETFFQACAHNLKICAERLEEIHQNSGRQIILCIEPEPGCCLDTCDDLTDFFRDYLTTGNAQQDERIRRYIGVCHDVCHSAVMLEDQLTAIRAYAEAGIQIGKVQVSSAIRVDFDGHSAEERQHLLTQLATFAEPRYLHQTTVKTDGDFNFYEDLPLALNSVGVEPRGDWRVHFHVPIYSSQLGIIETTQSQIVECFEALRSVGSPTEHFEIETYAWNVLPEPMREESLVHGIAKEFAWFESLVQ